MTEYIWLYSSHIAISVQHDEYTYNIPVVLLIELYNYHTKEDPSKIIRNVTFYEEHRQQSLILPSHNFISILGINCTNKRENQQPLLTTLPWVCRLHCQLLQKQKGCVRICVKKI